MKRNKLVVNVNVEQKYSTLVHIMTCSIQMICLKLLGVLLLLKNSLPVLTNGFVSGFGQMI